MGSYKYVIVVNGTIKHFFFENERDVLISAYKNYRKYYSDVLCFEIGYYPESESFYTRKMTIEFKEKGNVHCNRW